jgi:AraC-like DNA-binding protein
MRTQNNETDTNIEAEIKENRKLLGLTEVTGPGFIINLDDNRQINSSEVLNVSDYLVHEGDLTYIINELFINTDLEILTELLDSFFLKNFHTNENKIVKSAIFKILDDSKYLNDFELSKNLQVSRRHLNRLFNENLGVSVKNFQEIVRFRKAMTHKIFEKPLDNFTEISYEYNYSDQSHLNKVFSKLTHNSPAKFLKKGTYLGSEDIFWHLK